MEDDLLEEAVNMCKVVVEQAKFQDRNFCVIFLSKTCDFLGYNIKVKVLLRSQEVLLRHQGRIRISR